MQRWLGFSNREVVVVVTQRWLVDGGGGGREQSKSVFVHDVCEFPANAAHVTQ